MLARSNKTRYVCPYCGIEVYSNLIMMHMRYKCTADKETVANIESLFAQKKRYAWISSLGEESPRIDNWKPLVWTGKLRINELVFDSPRPHGVMRTSARKLLSTQRSGKGNPSLKNKPLYEKEDIAIVLSEAWEDWQTDSLLYRGIADFCRAIEARLPCWKYSFVGSHGDATPSAKIQSIISDAVGIESRDVIAWLRKCRGKRISIGQNNPETKRKLSASAYAALSGRRITRPHMRLFEMVKQIDPDAEIEFRIDGPLGSRFFDVFSPLSGACIEMHGRVWHDESATTPSLMKICQRNAKNDVLKRDMAVSSGYDYVVFWDDESSQWSTCLENYFKDKVYKKYWKNACLGYGDAS